VLGDDRVGGGKAQAAACLFGGEVGIENFIEVLRGNADSGVLDGDPDLSAGRLGVIF
jgi:hypothetical protein